MDSPLDVRRLPDRLTPRWLERLRRLNKTYGRLDRTLVEALIEEIEACWAEAAGRDSQTGRSE